MTIVKIPKRELAKHLTLNDELIRKISMLGIPVESVTEECIEIEVMPNRADALSVQGFIRALKAFLGKEPGLKKYRLNAPERNFAVKVDSSVKEAKRPYTACAIVKNLSFNEQNIRDIIDLQEKLHSSLGRNRKKAAIGIYPLEKITLPVRFEARKPQDIKFIPLESTEEMTGIQILQKHPTGREYAHLLEGLEKFPVFVDSKGKILSMPPIINSHETGKITKETRDIFIECSGYDLNTLNKILNIIVTALADLGGKIYQMNVVYGKKITTPDLAPEKMKISLDNTNKLLGLKLKESDLEKLLPRMGYDYRKGSVFIPAWRTDILHEVDIIEDIAIAYGYENIVPEIPNVATIGEESKESRIKRRISDILIGLECLEVSSYHLIKKDEAEKAKIGSPIELENSKTEYKILRPNLIIPALRTFSENKDNEYPQKIFEIGTVFGRDSGKGETGVKESENLLIAISPGNFTGMKEILDYLTRMLSVKYSLKEASINDFIEGRTGQIIINGINAGHIGEIQPDLLREFNIKEPVALIEISLEEVFKKA